MIGACALDMVHLVGCVVGAPLLENDKLFLTLGFIACGCEQTRVWYER